MSSAMTISVCIATYQRPERLSALLEDLARQDRLPDEIIIVDNDAAASAQAVVEQFKSVAGCLPITYEVQSQRGIALTRNRTVALASCEWLAFIDDDERAPASWLRQLAEFAVQRGADGVLGPVVPIVPPHAPKWIREGNFYNFPRMPSGTKVPLNRMRFGNVLLRGGPVRSEPGPFDAAYGLMTGEDADLLIRLVQKGATILWCDNAAVMEPVEQGRLSLRWLLQRALSGGQEFARKKLAGRFGPVTKLNRAQLFLETVAKLLLAMVLTACMLPFGRHRAVRWLTRAFANFGKLSVFWGWHYHEYA